MPGKCTFKENWTSHKIYKDWILQDSSSQHKARCRLCQKSLEYSNMGFAKSRPAAQGSRRPSGPKAHRPMAHDGTAARWPSPDFPQSFCPAVNPRTCTDLHRVWACKMDDGEFEFIYHFNNHFNPFRSFLSLHVAKCMLCVWFENNFDNESPLSVSVKWRMNREWKRSYLNSMQQTETRIQMIKMVNEFKLTVVHFARPNPMQICACPCIYRWTKKTVENQDWATGPPGHGPRAVGRGPLGLRAAGPLGRRGPWAAGQLLARPM